MPEILETPLKTPTPVRKKTEMPLLDTRSTNGSQGSFISQRFSLCTKSLNELKFKVDTNHRRSTRILKNSHQVEEIDQHSGTVNIYRKRKSIRGSLRLGNSVYSKGTQNSAVTTVTKLKRRSTIKNISDEDRIRLEKEEIKEKLK